MEREMSGTCFRLGKSGAGDCSNVDSMPQECRSSWYFTRKEIENNSPSRKDGIDLRKETQIRMLYCSFLQDVGVRLRVPQITIATAIMLCHRFYLYQSHVKNEWQTVATVCMFLASKVEDTPCCLDKVVIVAYETMYQTDPAAARRIQQKHVYQRQKALILSGETLLLCTIRFDFNIQHPYKPLHEAFKKFLITRKDVKQTAWNFVNDWLRTTLCLQYKPHCIAAGSLYLAAKHHNVKLPSADGYVWWQEFDIMPHQLNALVQQMIELIGHKRRAAVIPAEEKSKPVLQSPAATVSKEEALSSPESCVLSESETAVRSQRPSHDVNQGGSVARSLDFSDFRDSENPNGVVEDCEGDRKVSDDGLNKIDVERIRALMRARKRSREFVKCDESWTVDEHSEDAWIERELEAEIEVAAGTSSEKKQKQLLEEGL